MQNKNRRNTMKRYLLLNVFTFIWAVGLFATPQSPDKLIYNGDTISVYSLDLPIDFYNEDYTYSINLFGQEEPYSVTNCGRGYIATWEISDNQLYLTGICSCCYYKDSIKADLNILFKDKLNNGKVKADWITGNAFSPQGKNIKYEHDGIGGFYEYELEFNFNKGKLLETRLYDNTKFNRTSIYSQNQEKFNEFIYSNIRWDILPQQDTTVVVLIKFIPNENGKIDNVELLTENKEIYNQEAIRVIKLIPEWEVYFFKEKAVRVVWYYRIYFCKENREKYRK